jgi:hypothetical protein
MQRGHAGRRLGSRLHSSARESQPGKRKKVRTESDVLTVTKEKSTLGGEFKDVLHIKSQKTKR